ncbi:MAG: hypothetical protein AB7F91_14495 [Parvularculaceae bacterium]
MTARAASLRLVIDTGRAREASGDLDRVEKSADGAARAVDRLGDESKKTGRDLDGMRTKAAQMAATLGAAVGAATALAAALTFREAIKAASEAESAVAQLEAAIASTGGVARRTVDEIVALSGAIQKTSLFGDDEIQIAASNLLTFTNIVGDAFDKTLIAATNVSQRIGQDLVSTTLQLGKALNDPVQNLSALSRSGIQFSTAQEEIIKRLVETNQLAQAQGIILGELENQFGGAAEAARDTFGGAVTAAKNAYGDLLEVLGGPTIDKATDEFNLLADALSDPETLAAVRLLGDALSGILETFIRKAAEATKAFASFAVGLRASFKTDVPSLNLDDPEGSLAIVNARRQKLQTQIPIFESQGSTPLQIAKLREELAGLDQVAADLNKIIAGELSAGVSTLGVKTEDLVKIVSATGDGVKTAGADLAAALKNTAKEIQPFIRSGPEDLIARQVGGIVADIQKASAGANLSDSQLADAFEEAVRSELAPAIRDAIDAGIISGEQASAIIDAGFDELISNDNKNTDKLAEAFDLSIQSIGSLADVGSEFLDTLSGGIASLRDANGAKDVVGAIGDIGRGIGGAFDKLSAVLPALGPVGAVIGAAGQVAGFVESAIGFFKSVFGKPSDNAAGGGINFQTFSPENLFAKNNDPETIAARDEFLSVTAELARSLSELTGAAFAGSGIAIQVGRRDGTVIQSAAGGSVTTPVGDSAAALEEVFRQLVVSLRGGEKALVDYAKAASLAGRDADTIVSGLQALKSAFDLNVEPLSTVEAQLANIDAVIDPVIADLQALGQSIASIQSVARDAARAVGTAFIDDVQQTILDLQNGPLGDYNRLLKEIEQRQKDAVTLFQRGAITQGELASVDFLNGLQAQQFFENLSPDELAGLGDFFGILGDVAGETTVAMTRLTQAIVDFSDNVVETIDNLKREAETLQNAVDRATATKRGILRDFSPLLPGEQITDLRGQLGQILQDIREPGASAAFISDQINVASDVAKRLVDISAQVFGPTSQFSADRDFAVSILDRITALGQDQADERLTLADNARETVAILNEIREEFSRPDPSIGFLQSILDENRLQNTILNDLLGTYLTLATQQAAALNPAGLQSAANAYLGTAGALPAQTSAPDQSAVIDAIIRANATDQANANAQTAQLSGLAKLLDDMLVQLRQGVDLQRSASSFR